MSSRSNVLLISRSVVGWEERVGLSHRCWPLAERSGVGSIDVINFVRVSEVLSILLMEHAKAFRANGCSSDVLCVERHIHWACFPLRDRLWLIAEDRSSVNHSIILISHLICGVQRIGMSLRLELYVRNISIINVGVGCSSLISQSAT